MNESERSRRTTSTTSAIGQRSAAVLYKEKGPRERGSPMGGIGAYQARS